MKNYIYTILVFFVSTWSFANTITVYPTIEGIEGIFQIEDIYENNTVNDLKLKISQLKKLSMKDLIVKYQDSHIFGDTKLREYPDIFTPGIGVFIEIRKPEIPQKSEGYYITIRTLSGKTYAIEVKPDETILALKRKIQDKYGILVDKQRIIVNQIEQEDNKLLSELRPLGLKFFLLRKNEGITL